MLVTRISDNKEPQLDNTRKYREQPVRKKDTMTHEDYNTPMPRNIDSDESDSDEMLPIGAFWPAPEEKNGQWWKDHMEAYEVIKTLIVTGFIIPVISWIIQECVVGSWTILTGMITVVRARKEATQNDRSPTGDRLMTGPASASVRPAVRKRPNVIVVEPRKTADRPVICPVNVVPTPQVEVHKSRCVGTYAGELFPEEPEVVPAEMATEASTEGPTDIQDLQNDRNYKHPLCTTLTTVCVGIPKPMIQRSPDMMAEEASTGDTADNQPLSVNQIYTRTTVMKLPTDYVEIGRPAPWRVPVEVAREASTDYTMNEQCSYEVLNNNKTTDRKLSMELLKIPQQLVTRGFLELAEEARNIGVEKKQSFLVEEVIPQVIDMTRPMIEPAGRRMKI